MMTDAERFQQAQRDHLAELVKAASTRPAHQDYLERLLDTEPGDVLEDVRVPRGVSGLVSKALIADVEWIMSAAPEPGMTGSPFPGAYARLMLAWARTTAKRNVTREHNATWAGFNFGGK